MNPEVKKMWIEALTSGKYKQAKVRLKTEDAYCCLGVLCDLYKLYKNTPEGVSQEARWQDCSFYVGREYSTSYLIFPVRKWAGLDSADPQIPAKAFGENTGNLVGLSEWNDTNKSFQEIAESIKECL